MAAARVLWTGSESTGLARKKGLFKEIILLGNHLLLCGDSSRPADLDRLSHLHFQTARAVERLFWQYVLMANNLTRVMSQLRRIAARSAKASDSAANLWQ